MGAKSSLILMLCVVPLVAECLPMQKPSAETRVVDTRQYPGLGDLVEAIECKASEATLMRMNLPLMSAIESGSGWPGVVRGAALDLELGLYVIELVDSIKVYGMTTRRAGVGMGAFVAVLDDVDAEAVLTAAGLDSGDSFIEGVWMKEYSRAPSGGYDLTRDRAVTLTLGGAVIVGCTFGRVQRAECVLGECL